MVRFEWFQEVFGSDVPACALNAPILFRAIIAFSGSHSSKIARNLGEIAFAFHASCVELLLETLDSVPDVQGEYLAAACLLQSYEILKGKQSFSISLYCNAFQTVQQKYKGMERACSDLSVTSLELTLYQAPSTSSSRAGACLKLVSGIISEKKYQWV